MAITVLPSDLLRRVAPKRLTEKLVTRKLTVNRAAVQMLAKSGILSEKKIEELALRIIKEYKRKYRAEIKAGESKTAALEETLNQRRLVIQRVQNSVVFEITREVKRHYRGERYEWLPSDAKEPDPVHQLNYGKIFTVGRGEMPGDRYGCRCGMRILTEDEELFLTDELGV